MYPPPALQLPAEAHDTDWTVREFPPGLRAAVPGTSMAVCQVPFTSLTTKRHAASDELSVYDPPALQLPAEAHDTEYELRVRPC